MKRKIKNNTLFIIMTLIMCVIIVGALVSPTAFSALSNTLFSFITLKFGWLYLLAMFLFVIFSVWIGFSKYGRVILGGETQKPEYSTFSWLAMLFCAGMGVGLVFWGISEPLSHYANPMYGIEPYSSDSANFAFKMSFMHWGIHPWAGYAIVGLSLAYFQFNKNKSELISSTILIQNCVIKGIADGLAVFATVAGVVTSLGLGVLQINSGLEYLFGIPNAISIQILIICIISVIFIFSAVSGVNKGVKFLSNLNVVIAFIVLVLCFLISDKTNVFNNLTRGMGEYFNNFITDSLNISAYSDSSWVYNWHVFYWAWWIAWAPFVGGFIAKISKGRTIREFVLGVVIVPSLASFLWFSVMGTLGIELGINGTLAVDEIIQIASNPDVGFFAVLAHYPIGKIISGIVIVLLLCFFVTSADSGTLVLATMTSNGNPIPTNKKKIVWGVIQAGFAIVLLLVSGLKPLQTISIVAAFPFIFIMLSECFVMIRELRKENK